MTNNITDAELVIMDIIWDNGDTKAIDIALKAGEIRGWEKNTVYTMLTRLIKKGIIERVEPGYVCHALIDRESYRKNESSDIINKLFRGSLSLFARAFLEENKLSEKEIDELRSIINENK